MAINTVNELQAMQQEARAAAAARAKQQADYEKNGPKKFAADVVLSLKKNQRAMFRPVYNMPDCQVVHMHDLYKNTDRNLSAYGPNERFNTPGSAAPILNLCALKMLNKPCAFCENAAAMKREAKREVFIPVYVYKVMQFQLNEITEQPELDEQHRPILELVTKLDKESGAMVPVRGFRMIRAKQGSAVFDKLMEMWEEEGDITLRDYSLIRDDSEKFVKYICSQKDKTAMHEKLVAKIPPLSEFGLEVLAGLYPYKILESAQSPVARQVAPRGNGSTTNIGAMAEDDFDFGM